MTNKNQIPENLDDLLKDVTQASQETTKQQARAQAVVFAGARVAEALRNALGKETLRGLPNLGTEALPFCGLNLGGLEDGNARQIVNNLGRGRESWKIPFPVEGTDVGLRQTVLAQDGKILAVQAYRRESVALRRSSKPWFEFEVVPATLAPAQLHQLLTILPQYLRNHIELVRREAFKDDQILVEAESFLAAFEVATSSSGGRR